MIKNKKFISIALSCAMLLTSFSVYNSYIDTSVHAETSDIFRYTIENNEVTITGLGSVSGIDIIEIPSEIEGLPVTIIDDAWGAMYSKVIIPDSVKIINDGAFKSCYSLEEVVIPASVTEIGKSAFEGCSELKSAEILGNIEILPSAIFRDCVKLEKITIPDSVKSFGFSVFNGCSSLKEIKIPNGVTEIGGYAFQNCSSLTEIDIPDTVSSIGAAAFLDCSGITSMVIPQSVDVIENGLFNGCTSLKSIEMPLYATNGESTGYDIFKNCSSLESISIPEGMTSIGTSCFEGCSKLKNIILPQTIETIDTAAFKNCTSLAFIDLPYSAVYYSDTFNGCSSLKEIIIPNGTESLGRDNCFKDCSSVEKIVIPSIVDYSANQFDSSSFSGCDNLKELYIYTMHTAFTQNTLGYIYNEETDTYTKNENLTIYCRKGSSAEEYAVENGLNYQIVDETIAYVAYIDAYDSIKETTAEFTSYPDDITHHNYSTFIREDGVYTASLDFGYFSNLGNETNIIVCTGVSSAEYPDFKAAPVSVKVDGKKLFDIYETVEYAVEEIDGIYYLYTRFSSQNDIISQEYNADTVTVDFEVSGITGEAHDPQYITGDLDLNNTVNYTDYMILKQHILGLKILDEIQYILADINQDGKVNSYDMTYMKNYFLS